MITQALLDYLAEHKLRITKKTKLDDIPSVITDRLMNFCRQNKVSLKIYHDISAWRIQIERTVNKVSRIRVKSVKTPDEANEFLKEAVLDLNGNVIF